MKNEKSGPYFRRVHNEVREGFDSKKIWDAFSALLGLLNYEERLSREQLIDAKENLRDKIIALDIAEIDDSDVLVTLYQKLKEVGYSIPAPNDYPKVEKIRSNISDLQEKFNRKDEILRVEKKIKVDTLTASDLALYAEIDFEKVGDIGHTADYLHQLGLVIVSENAYEACFPDEDVITVDESCNVINGIHRALFIVTNPDIVEECAMDDYIKIRVQREN